MKCLCGVWSLCKRMDSPTKIQPRWLFSGQWECPLWWSCTQNTPSHLRDSRVEISVAKWPCCWPVLRLSHHTPVFPLKIDHVSLHCAQSLGWSEDEDEVGTREPGFLNGVLFPGYAWAGDMLDLPFCSAPCGPCLRRAHRAFDEAWAVVGISPEV